MTETLKRIEVLKFFVIIEGHQIPAQLRGNQVAAENGSFSNSRLYDSVENAQKAARSSANAAKTIEIHAYLATLTAEERAQLPKGLPLSSKLDSTQINLEHTGLRATIIRK